MSGISIAAAAARAAQCTGAVLMVRPASFGFNAETAASNALQREASLAPAALAARAQAEFDGFVTALRAEGIAVFVAEDGAPPHKPDAVFPNNWVSLHSDGTVVLYPMLAPNRRLERQLGFIKALEPALGFRCQRLLDFSHHEQEGRYLEGTGSLVLDHVHRIAYASRSPRTDAALVREWAQALNYEALIFDALDEHGAAYYHTNVLLWIGTRSALLCAEALPGADRERVRERLRASGRELIEIDRAAVRSFAGNLLELASWDEALGDCSVLVMSAAARAAFTPVQYARLSGSVDTVIVVPVPLIEQVGGGSVRCMLAEVPQRLA
jgi:hypothetical protein